MKKLNLKNLKLEANDLLQREQLKSIIGGYGSNGCAYQGGNGYAGVCGPDMTALEAQYGASVTGGNWCCNSCCEATWLNESNKNYLGC